MNTYIVRYKNNLGEVNSVELRAGDKAEIRNTVFPRWAANNKLMRRDAIISIDRLTIN